MSTSPRSRYLRSKSTNDGTVLVQLWQVNTQKLSRTTLPFSPSSVSGMSELSQLSFFQEGAGRRVGFEASNGLGCATARLSNSTARDPAVTARAEKIRSWVGRVIRAPGPVEG